MGVKQCISPSEAGKFPGQFFLSDQIIIVGHNHASCVFEMTKVTSHPG